MIFGSISGALHRGRITLSAQAAAGRLRSPSCLVTFMLFRGAGVLFARLMRAENPVDLRRGQWRRPGAGDRAWAYSAHDGLHRAAPRRSAQHGARCCSPQTHRSCSRLPSLVYVASSVTIFRPPPPRWPSATVRLVRDVSVRGGLRLLRNFARGPSRAVQGGPGSARGRHHSRGPESRKVWKRFRKEFMPTKRQGGDAI